MSNLYTFRNIETYYNAIYSMSVLKDLNLKDQASVLKHYHVYKPEVLRPIVEHLNFLKRLRSARTWAPEWVSKLNHISLDLGLKPDIHVEEVSASPTEPSYESFYQYVHNVLRKLRTVLNVTAKRVSWSVVNSEKSTFEDLLYERNYDRVWSQDETFYTADSKILRTQTTSSLYDTGQKNVLDYGKVFRRETVDSTHLCEFHQLEYCKSYNIDEIDVSAKFKDDVLNIVDGLGLDLDKIELRPTRYTYTYPGFSFEIFYSTGDTYVELGGCGVATSQFLRRKNYVLDSNEVVFAAGFGLDRCYGIVKQKRNLYQVHPHMIRNQ